VELSFVIRKCFKWAVLGFVAFIVVNIAAAMVYRFFPLHEVLWCVVTGWTKQFDFLSWSWFIVGTIAVVGVVTGIVHYIARWRGLKESWSWRHSTGAGGVVTLMVGASLAVAGGATQVLTTLNEEKMVLRKSSSYIHGAEYKLKDLYYDIRSHEFEYHRSAGSLEELERAETTSDPQLVEDLLEYFHKKGDTLIYYGVSIVIAVEIGKMSEVMLAHSDGPIFGGSWLCLMADGQVIEVEDEAVFVEMTEANRGYRDQMKGIDLKGILQPKEGEK